MTRPRHLATLAGVLVGTLQVAAAQEKTAPSVRPAIRVVALEGTPHERGLAHGKALEGEIRSVVRAFKAYLEKKFGVGPDEFIRRFRQGTDFETAIEKWTPGMLDEVRGIAEGAGLSYDTVYVLQLIDEIQSQGGVVLAASRAATTVESKSEQGLDSSWNGPGKGSSIGVDRQGNRQGLVAQNLDLPEWLHGFQTLLHITDEKAKLQSLVLTVPGLIGANGLNSASVGVCVNSLRQLKPCTDGLPVAFVVRGVLAKKEWHKARMFLYDVRHASGQNYLLGGRDVTHTFECSADRVRRFEPFPGARRTWHTDHPLVNEQYAPGFSAHAAKAGQAPSEALPPCPRFAVLRNKLKKGVEVDFGVVRGVLTSTRIPRTFATTFMVLGSVPELHTGVGATGEGDMVVHRFPGRAGQARRSGEARPDGREGGPLAVGRMEGLGDLPGPRGTRERNPFHFRG